MEKEQVIRSDRIYQGKIINLRVDTVELPQGGRVQREVVEHAEVVFIVPLDAQGNILLVEQYRRPADRVLLEIPAGGIHPGESPEEAAQRELREETGYRAGRLEHVASFYTTPGFCDEYSYLFIATELQHHPLAAEEDENISLKRVSAADVKRMLKTGEITDGKTIAGLLWYLTFCQDGDTN